MLVVLLRGLLLYLCVVAAMRIMGKRQIGQLQPSELVVAIMMADLAAVPMQDKQIPFIDGLIPIATLLLAEVTLSYLSLRNQRIREVVSGVPSVLIANGHLVEAEMRKNRINFSDLSEQLRNKGVFNMEDVEFAILETNGQLSIILKSQKRPVCPADLHIPTKYEGMPVPLILDGDISYDDLKRNGLDEAWLINELNTRRIASAKEVFYAALDSDGHLFYQLKSSSLAKE